jgi:serine/threonine-protein kinase
VEPLPERIGPYRVERRLGRGGMGEVFLAWDERLKRRVAIKRIRQGSSPSFEQREKRFRLEACAPACLSHSAIVQVHDILTDDAGDAIVMEYVEGSTLAERLAEGPLPVREALRLAREIAEGLAAAHAAHWIHRDLKAENVIITPQGQAKILDFGLVKPLAEDPREQNLTREGVLVGTYQSMSPEQASGGEMDERSDLFSLGTLLYEMLAGGAPFRGENPLDTLKRVNTYCPPSLSTVRRDLPPGASGLVDRLLAKSRDDRPHSAREVVRALGDLEAKVEPSGAESVSEMPTGDWTKGARKNGRRSHPPTFTGAMSARGWRRIAVAAGSVVLVAVATVMAVYFSHRPTTLRVAVASIPPTGDKRLDLAMSAVLNAFVKGLATLDGVTSIDPSETTLGGTTPKGMARAAASDEVLMSTAQIEGGMIQVWLRRVGKDGQDLGSRLFKADAKDLSHLDQTVTSEVQQLYAEYTVRPGTFVQEISEKDYDEFLAVKRNRDAGEIDLAPELARLGRVVQGSQRFLDAQLLAADISLSLYQSTRDPLYLERARGFVQLAGEQDSNDPRTLITTFKTELDGNLLDKAQGTLARLDKLKPGDSEVLFLHARLEDKKGQTKDAVETMRKVANLTSSWRNLGFLAYLEARIGQIDDARGNIREILRQDPGNKKVLDLLANIELLNGDLAIAESIYEKLANSSKNDPISFTNLGMARFFRGRFKEAATAYQHALEIDSTHIAAKLNLADVEAESGHKPEADALYRQVLKHFEDNPGTAGLQPKDGMIAAQCLARLGERIKAVEMAHEVLQKNSDDGEILSQAALVYCLVGDHESAHKNARAALGKGVQMRWFSAYKCLREDPDIRGFPEAAQRY